MIDEEIYDWIFDYDLSAHLSPILTSTTRTPFPLSNTRSGFMS